MKKSTILGIIIIAWIIIFIASSAYQLLHPPVLCWDGMEKDAEGNMIQIGSCDPDYRMAALILVPQFIVWILILLVLVIGYFMIRRSEHKR